MQEATITNPSTNADLTKGSHDAIIEISLHIPNLNHDLTAFAHVQLANGQVVSFLDEFDILDIFISEDQAAIIRDHYQNKIGFAPFIKPQETITDARDGNPFARLLPGYISFPAAELNQALAIEKLKLVIDKTMSVNL